ncbi:MAG: hypothetical protein GX079_01125 [Tissierellia bacterium]|nr:hypothetical protein [Tissierellia bacterium]
MVSHIAMNLKKTKDFILSYKSFLILPHVRADGDALGSSLALKLALEKINKKAVVWCEDALPHGLKPFMDGKTNKAPLLESFEALIAVDTANLSRIQSIYKDYDQLPILNIDHHPTNTDYGQVNLVYGGLSSTGELMAMVIDELGVELDKNISEALYIALISDTNRFQYDSITSDSLRLGARLLDAGADFDRIHRHLYGEKPLELLKLLSLATDKSVFLSEDVVFCQLTQEDFDRAGFYETDDVIALLRDIERVGVAALVYHQDGQEKLSLRSKGDYLVDGLAKSFGGGGHKKAAGSPFNLEDIELLKERLKELSHVGQDKSL